MKSIIRAVVDWHLALLSRLFVRASGKVPNIFGYRHRVVCVERAPNLQIVTHSVVYFFLILTQTQ